MSAPTHQTPISGPVAFGFTGIRQGAIVAVVVIAVLAGAMALYWIFSDRTDSTRDTSQPSARPTIRDDDIAFLKYTSEPEDPEPPAPKIPLPQGKPAGDDSFLSVGQLSPEEQQRQEFQRQQWDAEKSSRDASAVKSFAVAKPADEAPAPSVPFSGSAPTVPTPPPYPPYLADLMGDAGSNPQDKRLDFLKAAEEAQTQAYLGESLQGPLSTHELKAGQIIPCVLKTAINSDLPGDVDCLVRSHVYDFAGGTDIFIPQGAIIRERYDSRASYGQERLLVASHRMIYPDGRSIDLRGMQAVDGQGRAGLEMEVNNHWGKIIMGALLSAVLSTGAQIAIGPYQTIDPSIEQGAVSGFGRSISRAGERIVDRELSVPPTLERDIGYEFNVIINKDIILPVWRTS